MSNLVFTYKNKTLTIRNAENTMEFRACPKYKWDGTFQFFEVNSMVMHRGYTLDQYNPWSTDTYGAHGGSVHVCDWIYTEDDNFSHMRKMAKEFFAKYENRR